MTANPAGAQAAPSHAAAKLIDVLAIGVLVAHVAILASQFGRLPAEIATHFDVYGNADGFGPKAWLWSLPAVGAGLLVLLRWVGARTERMNLPVSAEVTSPSRIYALARRMVSTLGLIVNAMLLWGCVLTIRVALGLAQGLGPAYLAVSLGAIAIVVIMFLLAMTRAAGGE